MKAGIVTFHFVNNFGGALQAYALWRTAEEKLGCTTYLIDYRNWFIRLTDSLRIFPLTADWEEMKSGWKTMGLRLARLSRFRNFIKNRCRLTRRYRTGFSVCLHPPQCDAYICGSDQIWNPYLTCGLAGTYFLDFVREGKKFSYAASFGLDALSGFHLFKVKKYLKDFTDISVREKSGRRLVQTAAGREAVQLVDPVFLLEGREWEKIAAAPFKEVKSYILLYVMQRSGNAYEAARKMKERLGMPLVEISRYGRKPDFVDISLTDAGPEEFIWLFRNAGYVCTNSYHGLAFSLIFEKDFCLVPCRKFRTRITSLLELFQIDMPQTPEGAAVSYNKELSRKILEGERAKALHYLKKNTGGNDGKQCR